MPKRKKITIFTTTFNRGYTLHNLYHSLVNQTSDDFIWLVVDDGSTDNTKTLVAGWASEGLVDINYIYKENGGMHTGHNVAYENISTELNVCIDSDDFMPSNAVELILEFWDRNGDEKYAGILGLDIYKDGTIVSNKRFPNDVRSGKYCELKGRYGIFGDIKFVYRTDVIKQYPPYPIFPEEKFVPLGYKYLLIDQEYDMLFLNEPLCVVEYMEDGSSKNIIKQYFKSPRGFLHERKIRMVRSFTFKERFINTAHFISTCLYLGDFCFFCKSPNKLLTIFAMPAGILLHLYVRFTNKKGVIK